MRDAQVVYWRHKFVRLQLPRRQHVTYLHVKKTRVSSCFKSDKHDVFPDYNRQMGTTSEAPSLWENEEERPATCSTHAVDISLVYMWRDSSPSLRMPLWLVWHKVQQPPLVKHITQMCHNLGCGWMLLKASARHQQQSGASFDEEMEFLQFLPCCSSVRAVGTLLGRFLIYRIKNLSSLCPIPSKIGNSVKKMLEQRR